MKIEVEYLQFMWPMRHFLITCGEMGGKLNIIAVSFCMPVSKDPPLIACAIGKEAYSCKLIESTKEFIVNVPPKELRPKIYYCGFHSGYQEEKQICSNLVLTIYDFPLFTEHVFTAP